MFKHQLNICGTLIVVWGPQSINETYKCFIKHVAEKLHTDVCELMFALQLSPIENLVNHTKAYQAYSKIYSFIHQTPYSHKKEFFLKCDSFLSSSPPSRFVKAPIVKPVLTSSVQQTEIPVDTPKLTSATTTLKSWNMKILKNCQRFRKKVQQYLPSAQTIILLSATIAVIGFLNLPVR